MKKKLLLIGGCGYIGSFLYEFFKDYPIDTLDLERRGNCVNSDNIKMDYAEATPGFLSQYDVILWFAGHSSVGMAQGDPEGALLSNMVHLFSLQQKLSVTQRLIYASSGGIYNALSSGVVAEETETRFFPENAYDISKFAFDAMMRAYGDNFAGLRLGTLAGISANTRFDLVVNAMVRSAVTEGVVRVSGGEKRRSVLGIGDLARAVQTLVEVPEMETGFYNLASFNTTIGEIGARVAERFGVPLETVEGLSTYDFQMSTEKFCRTYDFTFFDTLSSLIDQVAQGMRGT